MSLFANLPSALEDPIFGLYSLFHKDKRPSKIILSIGVFIDSSSHEAYLNDSVKEAEQQILQDETTKTYLPITGHASYIDQTAAVIFGEELYKERQGKIFGFQTVGGTGALRTIGDFFSEEITREIAIPNPTWSNHKTIFKRCALATKPYPYYENGHVNFEKMCSFFKTLSKNTLVLLQPNAHNPTGVDLSSKQWMQLSDLMLEYGLVPLFDSAYQGLGRGIEKDAFAMRYFLTQGHEFAVAHSYSKSMGLYGERAGAGFIVTQDASKKERIKALTSAIIRPNYSNPPVHPAKIVDTILKNERLKGTWYAELAYQRKSILNIRELLFKKLSEVIPNKKWDHVAKGIGMFTLLGISPEQVDKLIAEYGIYLTRDGRINVIGLNSSNIDYFVDSLKKIVE